MTNPPAAPASYIQAVRAKVGHDLLLLPTVTALIWDQEERLLLVRHSDNGLWGTVGGMVEPDEAPHDAVIREALEEVGVHIRIERLRAALGGPRHRIKYRNGDLCSVVAIVYDAVVLEGVATPDFDEVTEARWFTIEELPNADLGSRCQAVLGELDLI